MVGLLMSVSALAQQPQQAGPPLSPGALVAALDEQIQVRFLDHRLGFGISRLCGPMGHGVLGQKAQTLRRLPQPGDPGWMNAACGGRDWALFRPRNEQEKWAIGEIEKGKVEVWALLVGAARRTLEGPVVAGSTDPQGLNEVRRQLLPVVAQTPIPEKDLAGWRVAVRPVRATQDACLGCHADTGKPGVFGPPLIKGLKLRDPLGYLVYLYRQR